MRTFLLLALLTATAAADVTLIDNDRSITVDCSKDPNVDLVGNHLTATLTGTCTKVTLTGNHNTAIGSTKKLAIPGNHNTGTLDAVDVISILGNENSVTWKTTVDPKKAKPKVGAVGRKNSISQVK